MTATTDRPQDTAGWVPVGQWDDLVEDRPAAAVADGVELVLVRRGAVVHAFHGRCPHRGAMLADGAVVGDDLVCGVHGWDDRLDTGASADDLAQRLTRFRTRGESGMLPEEQVENRRYLYELASGRFGWDESVLDRVQAVHLKLGQGAKTGTGGHLSGSRPRNLTCAPGSPSSVPLRSSPGTSARSPS